jgi:hypothetical protein
MVEPGSLGTAASYGAWTGGCWLGLRRLRSAAEWGLGDGICILRAAD